MVKKTTLTANTRKKLTGILLVIPSVVVLLLMISFPILQTLAFSFSSIKLPYLELSFAGVENFARAFSRPEALTVARNTMLWVVCLVLLRLLLGLGSAVIMNADVKGIVVLRVVALLPWTVPSIVTANMWRWILQGDYGVVNGTLKALGLGRLALPWLGSTATALPAVLLASTWAGYPFVMMMLLSAMQGLPRELYEAAQIDGASGFRLFRYITLPGIRPVLFVVVALEFVGAINAFDTIYVMTAGGPAGATEILSLFIYRLAFVNFDFGAASAVSVVLIMIAILGFCLYGPAQRLLRKRWES